MNTKILIEPQKGIIINNTLDILFGQTFNEIMFAMKYKYIRLSNKCYLFDNNLCLEFDNNNKLSFIEFSNCEIFTLNIWEQNPFNLMDTELILFLHEHCNINSSPSLNCDEITDYIIKPLDISLYRAISPYKILSSIKEAKITGDYNENMNSDYLKSRFFETIGVGNNGYFSQV